MKEQPFKIEAGLLLKVLAKVSRFVEARPVQK
jgi:hypothetical protein